MNCECIKNLEKKIRDDAKFKKKALKVEFRGIAFLFGNNNINGDLESRPYSEFHATLEGQKKKEIMKVTDNYCRFCGKNQKATDGAENVPQNENPSPDKAGAGL